MSLIRFEATDFRNFTSLQIEPASTFNLIYGKNASGKTSLLEAIHLLGVGRSFRSHLINRIIKHGSEKLSVFGVHSTHEHSHYPVGIERHKNGETIIKANGEFINSAVELAKAMPIQLINQDSFQLLDGGPKYRRQFLDWGVFHVEQSFFGLWKRIRRALTQRNAGIRQHHPPAQIKLWNYELVHAGLELEALRRKYMELFKPIVLELIGALLNSKELNMHYYQGWDEQRDLMAVLEEAYARDIAVGYTQYGPQRADLRFRVGNLPIEDVLSRGEQKLLIFVLRLAQGRLLYELQSKQCVYLIDDLPAELDKVKQAHISHMLAQANSQVFITGTDLDSLVAIANNHEKQVFHVEHGSISTVLC